ncbi:flagellin [Peptoanaerobacter stomatis]|uniref:Flagellin n=1 Tax=Peptoanaerobacter stomatis TaxID=796937 RepID=G9WZZ3_9FIRM|nr:flagellin [Peptoanaerobacter stomatis]EHL15625.1 flagellin [Peptoanaerobacter stomatis]
MIINHNMMSMNAHRAMGVNSGGMGKSVEKLSTGQRINRAADDAAGLYISEKMRSQVRGLTQASRNAQDGISAVQTAEGALDEVHAMLQRMRELAVQAGNDTNQAEDRTAIKSEIDQLGAEIDAISVKTQFNKQNLLDGTFNAGKKLQVGANKGQTLDISIKKIEGTTISIGAKAAEIKVDTNENAGKSLSRIDRAISLVSEQRSKLGAVQNRLEHTIKNLDNAAENTQAAESRIRDTDMAKEMSKFTKDNILTQASQAMLAQANQLPQQVLQLLR